MSDRGSNPVSADLARLGADIRELLARSDALGLSYVAIHLCNALESLDIETADPWPVTNPDGPANAG